MAPGDWRPPISKNERPKDPADDSLERLRAAFEQSKEKSWEAVSKELKNLGLDSKEPFAELEKRLGDRKASPSTRIFIKEMIKEWKSKSDDQDLA